MREGLKRSRHLFSMAGRVSRQICWAWTPAGVVTSQVASGFLFLGVAGGGVILM